MSSPPSPPTPSPAQLPSPSPLAGRLRWVIAVLQGRDRVEEVSLDDVLAPTFLASMPASRFVQLASTLKATLHPFSIDGIRLVGRSAVVALSTASGMRFTLRCTIEAVEPHLITELAVDPVRPASGRGSTPPAERDPEQAVDDLFARIGPHGPGGAVGVFRAGTVVFSKGYGLANLEHSVPIGADTVFRVGSVSKQFTAAVIGLLVLDGRVDLDDDAAAHFPEIPTLKGAPLRTLMHHTSGVRDYRTLRSLAGLGRRHPYSDDDLLALLARQSALSFAPRTAHLYSNSNYFLLGQLVARVTGSTLAQVAEERLFGPLGMKSTRFHDDCTAVVPHRATGYGSRPDGSWRIAEDLLVETVGSGNLLTSISDLARWDANFYDHTVGGSELHNLMHTRGRLRSGSTVSYCFGLSAGTYRRAEVWMHAGGTEGFCAEVVRFPEHRLTVACCFNREGARPTDLCFSIADHFLEQVLTGPSHPPAQRRTPPPTELSASGVADLPESAMVGRYFCHDLDATYAIEPTADGTGLEIVTPGTRSPLSRAGRGVYMAPAFRMRTVEVADERLVAFNVSGGRALGLRFERIASG